MFLLYSHIFTLLLSGGLKTSSLPPVCSAMLNLPLEVFWPRLSHWWLLNFGNLWFPEICILLCCYSFLAWAQLTPGVRPHFSQGPDSVLPRHTTKLRIKFIMCICLCKTLLPMARKAVLCNAWQSPRCPAVNPQQPKQRLSVRYMQSVLCRWCYGLCCWLWLWLLCRFYKFSFIAFTTCKPLVQAPHISSAAAFPCYVAAGWCYSYVWSCFS